MRSKSISDRSARFLRKNVPASKRKSKVRLCSKWRICGRSAPGRRLSYLFRKRLRNQAEGPAQRPFVTSRDLVVVNQNLCICIGGSFSSYKTRTIVQYLFRMSHMQRTKRQSE